MAAGDRDDPRKHVEVPSSGLVEQPLHVTLDDQQRLAVQRENGRVVYCLRIAMISSRDGPVYGRGT